MQKSLKCVQRSHDKTYKCKKKHVKYMNFKTFVHHLLNNQFGFQVEYIVPK